MKDEEEYPTMPHHLNSLIPTHKLPHPVVLNNKTYLMDEEELQETNKPSFEEFVAKRFKIK